MAATATATLMANSAHQRIGSSLAPTMASHQAGTRVAGGAGQIQAQKRQRVLPGAPMLEAPLNSSRRATAHACLAAPLAPSETAHDSALASPRQAGSHAAATAATWLTGSSRAAELQSSSATLRRQADVAAEAERRNANEASSVADRAVVSGSPGRPWHLRPKRPYQETVVPRWHGEGRSSKQRQLPACW